MCTTGNIACRGGGGHGYYLCPAHKKKLETLLFAEFELPSWEVEGVKKNTLNPREAYLGSLKKANEKTICLTYDAWPTL